MERRRRVPATAGAFILALLASCDLNDVKSHDCGGGFWCPPNTKCAPNHVSCLASDCGDGTVQRDEQCDGDGSGHGGETAGCNADCTVARCGDGVLNRTAHEECDGDGHGHGAETAACNTDCTNAKHGDGKVNHAAGEDCDGDSKGAGNGHDCQSPTCNANCTVARCGDGWQNPEANEQCDGDGQGHGGETATCNVDCTLAKHGDGKVNAALHEQCDGDNAGRGNGNDCQSPTCNKDCTLSKHGDGWANPEDGESCDGDNAGHGNGHDCQSPTCNANCTPSKHGDGWANPEDGEACDGDNAGHGNGNDCQSPACNKDCTHSKHGDGKVNPEDNEQCDGDSKGNGNGHDCSSATCNWDCTISKCGDGKMNALAGEKCDDSGATVNITSCPYGVKSCLKCDANCRVVTLSGPYCGDGHVNGSENCDDLRSLNCGTCNAPGTANECKNSTQTARPTTAKTTITASNGAELAALRGQTITYDDGSQRVTFEFGDPPLADATNVAVAIDLRSAHNNAANLRTALYDKRMMFVVPEVLQTDTWFSLTASNVANVRVETGNAPDGGTSGIEASVTSGFGCAIGAPCARNEDCASHNCSIGFCRE